MRKDVVDFEVEAESRNPASRFSLSSSILLSQDFFRRASPPPRAAVGLSNPLQVRRWNVKASSECLVAVRGSAAAVSRALPIMAEEGGS